MHRSILIRHADAHWGVDDLGALSARGEADASRVADLLANEAIEAIYSSPYPRALQTVAPLATRLGVPVQEIFDLRERSLGREAFADFNAAVRATWGDFQFAHPGGESNAAAQQRMALVHQQLRQRHPNGCIVISTHGNALALLLRHYDPTVGFGFWRSLTRPDVFSLRIDADGTPRRQRLWRPTLSA